MTSTTFLALTFAVIICSMQVAAQTTTVVSTYTDSACKSLISVSASPASVACVSNVSCTSLNGNYASLSCTTGTVSKGNLQTQFGTGTVGAMIDYYTDTACAAANWRSASAYPVGTCVSLGTVNGVSNGSLKLEYNTSTSVFTINQYTDIACATVKSGSPSVINGITTSAPSTCANQGQAYGIISLTGSISALSAGCAIAPKTTACTVVSSANALMSISSHSLIVAAFASTIAVLML